MAQRQQFVAVVAEHLEILGQAGLADRGAQPPDGHSRPVHLLAAMDHTSRVVLAASGMLAVAAGNPACPGPGDRRALEAGFAACPPSAAWMTPE